MTLMDYQAAFLSKNPSVFYSGSQFDLAFNYTGANQAADLSGNGRHAVAGGSASIGYAGTFGDSYYTDLNGTTQAFQTQKYTSRRNTMGNPNFERDQVDIFPAWWLQIANGAPVYNYTAVNSGWSASGSRSLKVSIVKENNGNYVGTGVQTNGTGGTAVPVTPGDTYYLEGTYNVTDMSAEEGVGNPIVLSVNFYTAGAAFVSGPFSITKGKGPQKIKVTGTVPATSAWAQINVYCQTTTANDSIEFYVDNILFESGQYIIGSPIFDGTFGQITPSQTYFDGDLPGANWEGTPGASTSATGAFATGSQRTFAGWAKRDTSSGYDTFVGMDNGVYPNKFGFYANTGNTDVFIMWPPSGASTSWAVGLAPTNTWFHWVLVLDSLAQTANYYFNGVSQGLKTTVVPVMSTLRGSNLWFGGEGEGNYWDGKMAMMGTIERALPANEILSLYNSIGGPVLA